MRDVLRLKRFGLGQIWAAGLGLMAAALVSACVVGPENASTSTSTDASTHANTKTKDAARLPSNRLSYFVASPANGSPSVEMISSTFQTLSGATVDVWREAEPTRTIAFDEIRALRIREQAPSPSLGTPTDYVVAEVNVNGSQAELFWTLLDQQGSAFLWVTASRVAAGEAEAIDFLPIVYALRPTQEESLSGVWVSAGTFRNRQEAEAFFEDLGDIPRTFVALSDSERAVASAANARLVDYAIWESVCDPVALARSGGRLARLLSELPDYEERTRGVDCRVRPEL